MYRWVTGDRITQARIDSVAAALKGEVADTFAPDGSFTHKSGDLRVLNPLGTFRFSFVAAAIGAHRDITIPLLTGNDTLAVLGLAQTFSALQSFSTGVDFVSNAELRFSSVAGTSGQTVQSRGASTPPMWRSGAWLDAAQSYSALQSFASGIDLTGTSEMRFGGAAGTSGQIPQSQGAGARPIWATQAAAAGAGTPLAVLSTTAIGSVLAHTSSSHCVFTPLFIPGNMTITKLGFAVGTASGNMSIAIYDAAGTRLQTSGEFAVPAAGVNWVAITSTVLTAGQYYIGISCNNTTATFALTSGATDFSSGTMVVVTSHPAPTSFTPPTIPGSVTGRGWHAVGVAL